MHDQPERKRGDRPGEDSPRSQTPPRRKPYGTPRLVAYGNLRDITLVKGGLRSDGNPVNPATKV